MDEKRKKRTSMILLLEHVHAMDELTDAEFGAFIRDYADYVETGFEPVFNNDRSLRMLWKVVKSFDDMNVRKMEKRIEINKRNANRRWNAKKCERMQSHTNDANGTNGMQKMQMDANDAISVSDSVSVSEYESVSEKKENSEKKNAKRTNSIKRFVPPTLEESEGYFVSKGSDKGQAHEFWYFYGSKGWMVGKNKMQNWHMAASRWMASKREEQKNQPVKRTAEEDYTDLFAEMFGGQENDNTVSGTACEVD